MIAMIRIAPLLVLLAACAVPERQTAAVAPPDGRATTAPPPRPGARTVEEFDTTSAEERARAAAAAPLGERELGRTIASLGDPTQPGFWVRTALTDEAGKGRLVYPVTGKSVQVELIPMAGDPGAGSQVSLAALRLLEAPLTALPELIVYGP